MRHFNALNKQTEKQKRVYSHKQRALYHCTCGRASEERRVDLLVPGTVKLLQIRRSEEIARRGHFDVARL